MMLKFVAILFVLSTCVKLVFNDHIVVHPFYIRSRIYDSHSANVQFQIGREANHRTCQMYRFTVRRNNELPQTMPEQDLTFWRNSLELQHLDVGKYNVCATICSEYSDQQFNHTENVTKPITACIDFTTHRSYYLVLTLYILVLSILAFAQFIFTSRKRKFKARIKMALAEVETSVQKWRNTQTPSISTEHNQSFVLLQNILTLPAVPLERAPSEPLLLSHISRSSPQPFMFHLDQHEETSTTEIP